MTVDFNDTVVLVTGANQGIGFQIAKKLGTEQKGYRIIMSGRRRDAIEKAAQELQDQDLSVEPLVLDVCSDESIAEAVKTIDDKYGRLDVLINNAAIQEGHQAAPTDPSINHKPLSTRDAFLRILDTNVAGVQAVTDAFIPLLENSSQTKRIIFMSSSLGSMTYKADPNHFHHGLDYRQYTVSKTASTMLALHYVAQFDGRDDWRLNICCPGHCATNLNAYSGTHPPEYGAISACKLVTQGADREMGTFTDINGVVAW